MESLKCTVSLCSSFIDFFVYHGFNFIHELYTGPRIFAFLSRCLHHPELCYPRSSLRFSQFSHFSHPFILSCMWCYNQMDHRYHKLLDAVLQLRKSEILELPLRQMPRFPAIQMSKSAPIHLRALRLWKLGKMLWFPWQYF